MWKWNRRPNLPMIFQAEGSECGIACLAMVAWHHGREISLESLRKHFPLSLRGLSMRKLLEAAAQIGLQGRLLRGEVNSLPEVKVPAMLHWDLEHIVVLKRATGRQFIIHDPARGILSLGPEGVSEHFTGIIVEFTPTPDFEQWPKERRLSLLPLIGPSGPWLRPLAQILLLSLFLELLLLAQPVLIRAVVDHGIRMKDASFILHAAGILCLAAVLHGATSFLRDWAVLRAGTALNLDVGERIFQTTLRLPLSYFEKRPIGHLVERYRITDEIERFMVGSLPLGLIDGLMALASLGLVMAISVPAGAMCFATCSLFFLVHLVCFPQARSRAQALQSAKREENGLLIETLTTMPTTKANGIERRRYQLWLNRIGCLIQEQRRAGRLEAVFRSSKSLLVGLNLAILLPQSGLAVLHGTLSLGTLLALIFYSTHFLSKATVLVERIFEFRLLGVHLERLEDLVRTEPELPVLKGAPTIVAQSAPTYETGLKPAPSLEGEVAAVALSFQYSPMDPIVLKDINLTIKKGEFVALTGPNGAGKTTLLKVLLGLYRPTAGRVLYDGVELSGWAIGQMRALVGLVTQDDQFFNGSIAENISLFDPEMDMDQVILASELACIHEDIQRTPMRYQTRIGQVNSPFSEGQRQKLLLARAFYRQPRLIFLDEGTANLDLTSERQVLENLHRLDCSKLVIAHRPATLQRADRVLQLCEGHVEEDARFNPRLPA